MALLTKFLGFCKSVLSDSSQPIQTLQVEVTEGEVKDGVEHYEPFGFTSNPPAGSDGLIAFMGGDRSNAVVICVAGRAGRVTGLAEGDVAIYNQTGTVIKLIGDTVEITGNVKITGNVDITGKVTVTEDVVAKQISLVEHTHSGVMPGGSVTSAPQ